MTAKYDQLKKNLKHFSETYSPGILTGTLDAARIAIIDLQEEIQELKMSDRIEIGMKDITGREICAGDTLVYGDNSPQKVRWNKECQTWGMSFKTGATTTIPTGCRIVEKEG